MDIFSLLKIFPNISIREMLNALWKDKVMASSFLSRDLLGTQTTLKTNLVTLVLMEVTYPSWRFHSGWKSLPHASRSQRQIWWRGRALRTPREKVRSSHRTCPTGGRFHCLRQSPPRSHTLQTRKGGTVRWRTRSSRLQNLGNFTSGMVCQGENCTICI